MIGVPAGFRVEPGLDMLSLVPPEGPQAGLIRYKERIRPLRRLGGIIEQQLQACPLFRRQQVLPPQRLLTHEGEFAALVEAVGEEAGQPARRFLGVVFGDDFYALTSALCLLPAQFDRYRDLVRSLVLEDNLGLGWRRRRCEYQPPVGWQPYITGLLTEWLPPEYPNEPTAITVWPANPRRMSPRDLCDLAIQEIKSAGGSLLARPTATAFSSDGGLRGQHLQLIAEKPGRGRRHFRRLIVVEDSHYSYALGLSQIGDGELATRVDTFVGTARSLQGLKPPFAATSSGGPASHWSA